ncbi:MAG: hypothetical protein RI985_2166 [Chloroflexota bacterium]
MDDRVIEMGSGHDDLIELTKAWAGTSLAFAIMQTGAANLASIRFIENLLVAAIVCGVGFVVHEVAHQKVAQRFGAKAHFAADNRWLLISIALAFTGFFIAAPGAVWHTGVNDTKRIGQIALAGPLSNYILALIFLLIYPLIYVVGLDFDLFLTICMVGFSFNAWIGLFNMIPLGPFDGTKVLAWSRLVYGVMVAVGVLLAFVLNRQEFFITVWGWMVGLFLG